MDDELRRRIDVMKERAVAAVHEQFCGIINECQSPVIVDIATRDLIAEVERLERENARLRNAERTPKPTLQCRGHFD